jgi:chromatin structure-remodeling complex subunit RSC9
MDHFEGKDIKQVPMSVREVYTPGNRPALFLSQNERTKSLRQPDFYDPFYPLRYLEVPKGKCC